MKKLDNQRPLSTDSLLLDIVHVLEAHGIDAEMFTLYDYIDPDALEQLVVSADASLEVRMTIEGIELGITRHGVHALDQPSNVRNSSPQQ